MTDALTSLEREIINDLGELWGKICNVVDDGPSREKDLGELVSHIHALQRAMMAQAAARCYPEEFRALGSVIAPPRSFSELERSNAAAVS